MYTLLPVYLLYLSPSLCLSNSLQRDYKQLQQQNTNLTDQLTAAASTREAAELALKSEQSSTARLKQENSELKMTCENYTVEINSLLRDLDEHTASISTLTEERDKLKSQVSGLEMEERTKE